MAAVASDGNRQMKEARHSGKPLSHSLIPDRSSGSCSALSDHAVAAVGFPTEPHPPQANSLTGCIFRVAAAPEGQTSHASSQKGFVGLAFGQTLLATTF